MTKTEIIDETVAFYTSENRGTRIERGTEVCEYKTSEGNMCGIGRCLKDGVAETLNQELAIGIIHEDQLIDTLLKPQYRGHDILFWRDIQSLHDFAPSWDKNGLTAKGQIEVDRLHAKYSTED